MGGCTRSQCCSGGTLVLRSVHLQVYANLVVSHTLFRESSALQKRDPPQSQAHYLSTDVDQRKNSFFHFFLKKGGRGSIIINSKSGVLRVKNKSLDSTQSSSHRDFREVISVMKVGGGKRIENCCNLEGNVI